MKKPESHLFKGNSGFSQILLDNSVERAMGIEPTALAWEARVLPLYDARSG